MRIILFLNSLENHRKGKNLPILESMEEPVRKQKE